MSTIKPFAEKQLPKEKELAAKEGKIEKIEKHEKQEKNEKLEKDKEGKDQKDAKEQKESKEQKEHKEKTEKEGKERKEKLEKEHKIEKHEKPEKEIHKEHPDKQLPIEKQIPIESIQGQMNFDPASVAPEMVDPQTEASQAVGAQFTGKFNDKYSDKYWYFEKIHREKLYKIEKNEFPEYLPGGGNTPDPYLLSTRIDALESTVGQLMHFIPQESRPDLSAGALKNEEADAPKKEEPTQPSPAHPSKEGEKGRKP